LTGAPKRAGDHRLGEDFGPAYGILEHLFASWGVTLTTLFRGRPEHAGEPIMAVAMDLYLRINVRPTQTATTSSVTGTSGSTDHPRLGTDAAPYAASDLPGYAAFTQATLGGGPTGKPKE
jgi:hypothetical protein